MANCISAESIGASGCGHLEDFLNTGESRQLVLAVSRNCRLISPKIECCPIKHNPGSIRNEAKLERYRERKGKDTLLSLAQCPHPPAPIDLAKIQFVIGYYSSVEKYAAPQA